MEWALAAVAVLVLAAAAVVGSGRWGSMPPTVDDRYPGFVPDGWLDGDDVRGARFAVVPRGYSMNQVDALLARLATQLDHANVSEADAGAVTTASWPAAAAAEPETGLGGASAVGSAQDASVTTANMPDGIFRMPPGTAL